MKVVIMGCGRVGSSLAARLSEEGHDVTVLDVRPDAFIAVTQGDNRNVLATRVAKHIFGVPRTLCRIYDPIREEMYRGLGLETISPTVMGSNVLHDLLIQGAPVGEEA